MKKHLIPLIALLLIFGACHRSESKQRNEEARNRLDMEMADSLASFEKRLDSLQTVIPQLMTEADELLKQFDRVDNPREVEGYYILRSARNSYPLTTTGMTARLTNNETLELIAALQGGFFDRIVVSDGNNSVESDIVPHDQALNYRIGNFTTVAFTGSKADSVAALIASAPGKVSVSFLNPGKTGNTTLSDIQKNIIADTYRLYEKRREINAAEKEIPILARKCQILRERTADRAEQTSPRQR
ncbi:MAG: hypothetical protein HDS80_04085 [Bacteroidales bacterium]|nr:hypothetical protein [Bacteroidales bacterium]